jgi:phosphonate transport system substrate-binding protein
MPSRFAPFNAFSKVQRRAALGIIGGGLAALATRQKVKAEEPSRDLSVGLTPVFLNNDLELLSTLKSYLEKATGQAVRLVLRRTYEEITTLLVSRQPDAAWICRYPFVSFRDRLELLAVPVWRGEPLYRSYIITGTDSPAEGRDLQRATSSREARFGA